MRRFIGLIALVFCAACHDATGPTVFLNEQFSLAPNESATLSGTGARLEFTGVDGDSRCPADAVCMQAGDAHVNIDVSSRGTSTRAFVLHTGETTPVEYAGLTIALVALTPFPSSGVLISPGDYRATFRVTN
jgi:hypothetical protein